MKLQLFINQKLHNELSIGPEEFINYRRLDFQRRVEEREERIKSYIGFMKAIYYKAIAKSDSWYIVLIVRSRKFNLSEEKQKTVV